MFTLEQQEEEIRKSIDDVVNKWCPETFSDEAFNVRMMRALLNVHAYTLDAERVLARQEPIRTFYPLPLPKAPPQLSPVDKWYQHQEQCSACRIGGEYCTEGVTLHNEFITYMESL